MIKICNDATYKIKSWNYDTFIRYGGIILPPPPPLHASYFVIYYAIMLVLVIRFMADLLRKYKGSVVIMVGRGGAEPHYVHN